MLNPFKVLNCFASSHEGEGAKHNSSSWKEDLQLNSTWIQFCFLFRLIQLQGCFDHFILLSWIASALVHKANIHALGASRHEHKVVHVTFVLLKKCPNP